MAESRLHVAVSRLKDGRFAVSVVDIGKGTMMRGPDGGETGQGYTSDELWPVLRDRYGMNDTAIAECIADAEQRSVKPHDDD